MNNHGLPFLFRQARLGTGVVRSPRVDKGDASCCQLIRRQLVIQGPVTPSVHIPGVSGARHVMSPLPDRVTALLATFQLGRAWREVLYRGAKFLFSAVCRHRPLLA
jgi:hypothetical protein